MTVQELINELEGMCPDSEVRWAAQPAWPFEYSIGGVTNIAPRNEDDEDDEDIEHNDEPHANDVVYLIEGNQLGYLPGNVCRELGWRG